MAQRKVNRKSSKSTSDGLTFWNSIIRAAEAVPQNVKTIRGSSGIQHRVITAGLDETRHRLLIISLEHDARSAILAQADIQAALRSVQVIVARPVMLNISSFVHTIPTENIKKELLAYLGEKLKYSEGLIPVDYQGDWQKNEFSGTFMNFIAFMVSNTQHRVIGIDSQSRAEVIQNILTDPTEQDREFGVCAIPVYDFSSEEIELLQRGGNIESIKDMLCQHSLLQYFFPPPDQLALGLIERIHGSKSSNLLEQIHFAPQLGHPFGATEIASDSSSFTHIIEKLHEKNLIVEGEFGLEITPKGKSIRQKIKFKPREGILSKLVNRFSFKLEFKNLFGLGRDA